jgi:IS4 transposase
MGSNRVSHFGFIERRKEKRHAHDVFFIDMYFLLIMYILLINLIDNVFFIDKSVSLRLQLYNNEIRISGSKTQKQIISDILKLKKTI